MCDANKVSTKSLCFFLYAVSTLTETVVIGYNHSFFCSAMCCIPLKVPWCSVRIHENLYAARVEGRPSDVTAGVGQTADFGRSFLLLFQLEGNRWNVFAIYI